MTPADDRVYVGLLAKGEVTQDGSHFNGMPCRGLMSQGEAFAWMDEKLGRLVLVVRFSEMVWA